MKKFSTSKQDYYSLLQINSSATLDDVRAAYKRQALLTHPDRSRHPQANQRMQLLNEAYEVLGNPEKRARYDQERMVSSALVPVEKPPQADHSSQVDRRKQKDLEGKLNRLLRNQLIIMTYLILLTIGMFFWFLASGEANILMILLIVLLAVITLASMIMRANRLDR